MPFGEPYDHLQKLLRQQLKRLLRRSAPRLTRRAFDELFSEVPEKEKLALRFFACMGDTLEWKLNVQVADLRQIKSSKTEAIVAAYHDSHRIGVRTPYPHLVEANKKHLIHDAWHEDGQVYGFDLLLRPPRPAGEPGEARQLEVGRLSFAFIIHVALDAQGRPVSGEDYFVRAAWGESLKTCRLWENLREPLEKVESTVLRCLETKDYPALCQACVAVAEAAAARSFPM